MNLKTIFISLMAASILSACGSTETHSLPPQQMAGIMKGEGHPGWWESTPILWNGELLYVVSTRGVSADSNTYVSIFNENGILIWKSTDSDMAFISAYVENGVLYIFGTVHKKTIFVISSADLINWTDRVAVFDAPNGLGVFNTSVSPDQNGYIMAVETNDAVPYTEIFLHSTDLMHWDRVGGKLNPSIYSACPTIRYFNGYYYVFVLRTIDNYYYYEWAERSADLVTWEQQKSPYAVLSPESGDGTNTSDIDFVEINGVLHMIYINGDQSTWGNARTATYNGTFADLVNQLFN